MRLKFASDACGIPFELSRLVSRRLTVRCERMVWEQSEMFWWFQRGEQLLRCETREVGPDAYELVVLLADGTERIETFTDAAALHDRQVALMREFEDDGWSGPHGWHV